MVELSGGSSVHSWEQSTETFAIFDDASRVTDVATGIDQQDPRRYFGGASTDALNVAPKTPACAIKLMSRRASLITIIAIIRIRLIRQEAWQITRCS